MILIKKLTNKKRLILIGILFFLKINSFSQVIDWYGKFAGGLANYHRTIYEYSDSIVDSRRFLAVGTEGKIYESYYSDIMVGFKLFNKVNIENSVETFFSLYDGFGFIPSTTNYVFNGYFSMKGFKIGYKHMCDHPIISSGNLKTYYWASYNKIYFEVQFGSCKTY